MYMYISAHSPTFGAFQSPISLIPRRQLRRAGSDARRGRRLHQVLRLRITYLVSWSRLIIFTTIVILLSSTMFI
jgi:hypothetical protein